MAARHLIEEIRYQLSVGVRRLRYSRWLGGPRHREIAREHLRRFFTDLNEFLRHEQVDYWLAYGTLLGWHREQDLILGDSDIDIGLPESAYPHLLAARSRIPAGYRLVDHDHRKHGGPKMYVTNGVHAADLYFYADRGDTLKPHLRSAWVADRTPVPRDLILPTQTATLLGQPTRVPHQPEALLRWTYRYLGRDGILDRRTGYWSAPGAPTRSHHD